MITAQQYLSEFLQWERTHPNEPFRDWPNLVNAIATVMSDEAQLRAVVGAATQSDERLRAALQAIADEAARRYQFENYPSDAMRGFSNIIDLASQALNPP